ncbi:hypothetical protein niasHS_006258 [Heterodera schachtii]|uniref:Secretory protein n=1 Tax=Heterodera schachtii TaxID=97005 RepID=A0ABD2JSV2_HETSC
MFNNFPSLCSTFVVFQLLFTAQFPPKVRAMFCGIKALKYQMMEDISNDDGNGERGCEWDSAKSECVPNKEAKEFVSLGEGEKKKKVKKKKQGKWRTKRKN